MKIQRETVRIVQAQLGTNVGLVGAGALVPPGAVVPPGALALGSPARVVRQLSEEERASLRASAARYVELSARYRAEGWGKR